MKQLTFLVKPSSSLCNMRCRYCFYEDISEHRSAKSYGFMSQETAEALVRAAFDSIDPGGTLTFAFQGGEPTLIGLPFYEAFLALESKYIKPGVTVHHAIQTNGQTLDESWALFFRKHQFLVGLSVDGTKDLHDLYRIGPDHNGTWKTVTKALSLLEKHSVEVNLLCVVTKQCARSGQKVYQSLKKLGVRYLQFIPCLDPMEDPRGAAPYSLTPDAYGHFLCALFDAWYLDWKAGQYVSVRLFDDYAHLLLGQPSGSCATSGHCGNYLVVEGDGSFYPCDFYVFDDWRLGNVLHQSPVEACSCERACKFLSDGDARPDACSACPWHSLCLGGCKRDWYETEGQRKNYYCPAFQMFFAYAYPRLQEIALAEYLAMHRLHP